MEGHLKGEGFLVVRNTVASGFLTKTRVGIRMNDIGADWYRFHKVISCIYIYTMYTVKI